MTTDIQATDERTDDVIDGGAGSDLIVAGFPGHVSNSLAGGVPCLR